TKEARRIIFRITELSELGTNVEAFPVELGVSWLTPTLWLRDLVCGNVQQIQPTLQRLRDAIADNDDVSWPRIKPLNQGSRIRVPRCFHYSTLQICVHYIASYDAAFHYSYPFPPAFFQL